MNTAIVEKSEPVTLVGGGDIGPEDLELALERARTLVAADSGALVALAQGRMPDAVIGDMDSLPALHRVRIPDERLHSISEQDSTDFDKALRHISAPLVLGVGFLGARVDHQLATFNAMVRHADRPCVLLGASEAVFHLPPRLELDLVPGDVVSLFPLVPVTARSEGLFWPLDGFVMAPDGQIGTSNRATGPVQIESDGPGLLAIVPRGALDGVIRWFLSPRCGRWPARGG
ncbi:thiamine diphosphokinase [Ruegeria pomeroyi]|uniref:Thiamine diphosphokinase n=1 Tax=Ruegeria alba TaxID=2916756 RepID=A0ABS9NVK1_9RHOB|nr:thiamine diphosphokinase [Ruegeria alba]MCE8513648.1 thiamine diphosphokinase [Ruegeria pomeroyi]MCE8521189.1 thiamine diphosphokinase [Ruegeria pomeroyi]MCE8525877.1 thiamine diphosphokinase [Ruegeria pomeroyi]MCE8529095.1 thiamine diphosphokinase [Ruegeria pomeroyi]MCE8533430.1 thiamine diphosphokinase [Ruegeria pomeroyi]